MSAVRITALVLLAALCFGVVALSQLDTVTVGKAYSTVSRSLHIDLKAFKVDTIQISNAGHLVAGFVLCGLGQLLFRRWYVLPLMLFLFLALEAGQYLTPDRQPDVQDLLRSWGGVILGYLTVLLFTKIKRPS